MTMTADDVTAILGPIDEVLMAEILSTDATRDELAQAWVWLQSDEALINEGRPLPSGRVAVLIDLLSPDMDDLEG
ncbi:hypothetical protein [Bosea sp. LC85]|uniref:hypothetical protein n=1 Tax=Bosea sp. LC85 TaxID=1502851 RepID=UPI0005BE8276|nr:hypothetical protein [Bosea sp. LC85]